MAVKVFYDSGGRVIRTTQMFAASRESFPSSKFPAGQDESSVVLDDLQVPNNVFECIWDGETFIPAPPEPKQPEAPSVEQRIADLEEALALLHMEVVKLDTASTA